MVANCLNLGSINRRTLAAAADGWTWSHAAFVMRQLLDEAHRLSHSPYGRAKSTLIQEKEVLSHVHDTQCHDPCYAAIDTGLL